MRCNNCGMYNDDSSRFCSGCGADMAAQNQQNQQNPNAQNQNYYN